VLKLSTRARYGTRLMVNLALHYGQRAQGLRRIAEVEGISARYLEQIVLPLRHMRLVRGIRGANGGYELARHPSEIKLSEILFALEGPLDLVECVGDEEYCSRNSGCGAHRVWQNLTRRMTRILEDTSLEDIARDCAREPGLQGS
jgi:Rrf2 family protein